MPALRVNAGIVDEGIGHTPFPLESRRRRFNLLRRTYVDTPHACECALLADELRRLLARFGLGIPDCHMRAGSRHAQRHRAPDPLRRAGDDDLRRCHVLKLPPR
jgi:hypothetical protein